MQVVSRGTIRELVEDLAMRRSIVPCGTIASFGTGFVGQPTDEAKGPQFLFGGSKQSRFELGLFVPRGTTARLENPQSPMSFVIRNLVVRVISLILGQLKS